MATTLEDAQNWMATNNRPYWRLEKREGGVGQPYNLFAEFVPDGSNSEQGIMGQAVAQLASKAALYKDVPNVLFHLYIRKDERATHGTAMGPFAFTMTDKAEASLGAVAQTAAAQSVHEQQMSLLEQRLNLQAERREFEREKADFAESVRQTREDLKELEKKYESDAERFSAGLNRFATPLLHGLLGISGQAPAPQTALSGTETSEPETQSPQEAACNQIATLLYENVTDLSDLARIQVHVERMIDDIKARSNGDPSKIDG